MWTIRDANKQEVSVKRGVWKFSSKWNTAPVKKVERFGSLEDHTAESSPDNRGFSPDDGVWGAATVLGFRI
jgi:hypothetical protein